MSRKILIVLSEWGFWGEELIGPLETFDAAGYESAFVTPTGKRPVAISVSWESCLPARMGSDRAQCGRCPHAAPPLVRTWPHRTRSRENQ